MTSEIKQYAQRELRKSKNRLEYSGLPKYKCSELMGEIRAYNDILRFIDTRLRREERKDEAAERELARLLRTS